MPIEFVQAKKKIKKNCAYQKRAEAMHKCEEKAENCRLINFSTPSCHGYGCCWCCFSYAVPPPLAICSFLLFVSLIYCLCVCLFLQTFAHFALRHTSVLSLFRQHTYVHTHMYIYIYVCMHAANCTFSALQ